MIDFDDGEGISSLLVAGQGHVGNVDPCFAESVAQRTHDTGVVVIGDDEEVSLDVCVYEDAVDLHDPGSFADDGAGQAELGITLGEFGDEEFGKLGGGADGGLGQVQAH